MSIRDNLINYWKPILISFFILYGSITSGKSISTILPLFNFPYMDKIIHMFLYFILSITILASLIRSSKTKKNRSYNNYFYLGSKLWNAYGSFSILFYPNPVSTNFRYFSKHNRLYFCYAILF